ncbi:MAG: primary-amine oxidase [Actinomycetota bacterium]
MTFRSIWMVGVLCLTCSGLAVAGGPPVAVAAAHPLDPLTESEIRAAFALLKAEPRVPQGAFFPTLVLQEPPKAALLAWRPGAAFARQAYAEIFDRPGNRSYEAILDLRARRMVSWTPRPGVQPATFANEYELLPNLVRQDPRWQAAMKKRGVTDFDAVHLEVWAGGDLPVPGIPRDTRLLRVLSFYRGALANPYDRPIEGVVAAVDANKMRVVEVTDTAIAPISSGSGSADGPPSRPALKPLRTIQPEGPGFTMEGGEVRWQNWRFRVALHPRDGLVLYTVGYEDHGRLRSILHRAALSEISVPYGLPDRNWEWRSAFDLGEYGFGRYATKLKAGVDVPDNATLLDSVLADDKGGVVEAPAAIGVYERYAGLLWKRVDPVSVEAEARAARELVVTSNAWIGNYVYGVNWIFRQDGTIGVEVDLTGTLLLRGVVNRRQGAEYGTPVANYLAAPYHQHFFNFRLDFDVDGDKNSVMEMDVTADGRGGNGIRTRETMLRTERQARRDMDLKKARMWKVSSAGGGMMAEDAAPGYMLMPHCGAVPYAGKRFPARKRAAFVEHQLWATAYKEHEQYAAGPYPYQGRAGEGLPAWTADDEPLEARDVVLWYTLGVTHIPTPEQHPVMSVEKASFRLMPAGFFKRNPALDVAGGGG